MSAQSEDSARSRELQKKIVDVDDEVDAAEAVFLARDDLAHINFTKKDDWFCRFVFLVIGNTQLLIWNFVINAFVPMQNTIWPGYEFSNLLGGFEHGAAFIVALIFIRFNGLNKRILHVANVANIFLYILFALVPQFASGNDHIEAAKACLSIVCALMGLCVGVFHSEGYAFAAVTPKNYCGYISAGNGVAGAVSFIVYEILAEGIFTKGDDLKQMKALIWVLFVFGALCAFVQLIVCAIFLRKEWLDECVEHSQRRRAMDLEEAARKYGERRSVWAIFCDAWVPIVAGAGTLGFTCLLFPATGPFAWHKVPRIATALNGTFQMVDLLTRFGPNLGKWFILPKCLVPWAAIARIVIFLPFFLLPAHIPEKVGFLSSTGWLFCLFVVFTASNGWVISSATLYVPNCVTHPAEKEIVAEIFVIFLIGCITAGIFMNPLPVKGVN